MILVGPLIPQPVVLDSFGKFTVVVVGIFVVVTVVVGIVVVTVVVGIVVFVVCVGNVVVVVATVVVSIVVVAVVVIAICISVDVDDNCDVKVDEAVGVVICVAGLVADVIG